MRKIFSILFILMVVISTLPITIKAEPKQIVLDGGYVATVVGYTTEGRPIFQVNFAAPTYCDDKVTRISTQWYEQADGSFKSGDNKFDSSVSNEKIKIEKGDESIEWTPEMVLVGAGTKGKDLKLTTTNAKAEILDDDPMNENYHRNTLVWHYSNGVDRYFRLIEGSCQEYFQLNQPLSSDLVIDPKAIQTKDFKWYEKAVAYDEVGTGVKLTEDSTKKVTVKASSMKESSVVKGKPNALKPLYKDDVKEAQQEQIADNLEPEVMYPIIIDPNYTFIGNVSDGFMFNYNGVYPDAWVAINATGGYVSNTLAMVGQQLYDGSYYVMRGALYFDTTALSSSATITGVDLKLRGASDGSDTDFNITLQQGGTTYPHIPLLVSDYNQSNYTTTSAGVFATSGWSSSSYNTLSFNAADFTMINKTGTTKLLLRSSRDIATPPDIVGITPTGDEYVEYFTYEMGANFRPQLIVTFTAANPSITTVAASIVATHSARLNSTITDDGGEIEGDTEVRFGYGTTELLNVGTFANDSGTATPTGAVLSGGFTEAVYRTRTFTVTVAGTFNVTLPAGVTGTATSGTATVAGSPKALPAGATTSIDTGATIGNFTVEIITVYDTVTAWADGWGLGNPNAYLDVSGLADTTAYYFRAQVKNTTSTQSSANELTFTTEMGVSDVSIFSGIPDTTSIDLEWILPLGATQALIMYRLDHYPTTIADGTQVYLDTGSNETHTGLAVGATHYYSIWGKSGADYSTNAKNLAVTTLGADFTEISSGDALPTPALPSGWSQPVDSTMLQKFEPFYSLIGDFSTSWGMPANTMWLIFTLLGIGLIGLIVLVEAQNIFVATLIVGILMMLASIVHLLPLYFIFIAIIMFAGVWAITNNNG